MMLRLLLPAAFTLMVGSAEAGSASLMGAGLAPCGKWTEERRHSPAHEYINWIFGFLSGVGYAGPSEVDPLRGVDSPGLKAWVDNYCRAHPLERIVDAAKTFTLAHPH
jgi:hypothetical protein